MNRLIDNVFIFIGGAVAGGVIGSIAMTVGAVNLTGKLMKKHIINVDLGSILYGEKSTKKGRKDYEHYTK